MSLIQTDKETGTSLYAVMYFGNSGVEELKLHARDLTEATVKARRMFGRGYSRKILSIGLTVGGYEDAHGIHL
jgi:hypothetical protein